jgi:RimJ/RimL family protein N-acetyltransferase
VKTRRAVSGVDLSVIAFPAGGLRVDELLLRAPAAADVAAVAPAFMDDTVGGEAGLPKLAEAEIRAFIEQRLPELQSIGRLFPLLIVEGDTIVGGASLNNYDVLRSRVEIGYWLYREGRGRGIATRVARALAEHAFDVGVQRVEAVVRPENDASIRVLERAGFTREGLLRSLLPHGAERADAVIYSLLPGE